MRSIIIMILVEKKESQAILDIHAIGTPFITKA